jgi:hypothetical protein
LREDHRLKVFGIRVVRRIFGPKRDEVTGDWRRLLNEYLHDIYSSPRSMRMRWAGHMACAGESYVQGFGGGNLREREHLDELGVDGRMIWIFKKWDGAMDWIYVAQDRENWRAPANALMNFRVT